MNKLIIDLGTLPETGKRMEGELDPSIFDLPPRDPQPKGPLSFDLHVQRFEGEVLLQGSLSCPFEFECVRTLHPFIKTVHLPHAAIAVEVGNFGEVDATEALREELLLEIPNHPTCEIADTPQECEIDPHYLAVDKGDSDDVDPAPPEGGDSRWSALDSFQADES
ncbi:hypothetical protein [Roseibacillus persicicus]|uniref:DUF177 domain-containing protein n=1 Tax=Roseibacillus persicicus TaxID=454148 RepID=A0A918TWY9_9BACT|nr:hypothetical protein [Roseibacillus persicicus]GHC64771.1 hypothetical protein GCM10007100_35550 [Roseibacillus persicicus]